MLKKLLILDDDDSFLRACALSLNTEYEVFASSSIEDAFKILACQQVHALVIDQMLGVSTGEDFLDQLRLRYSYKPHIIFVSGFADKDLVIRLINRKVSGFLEKPVSLDDLKNKLSEILNDNHTYQEFDLNRENQAVFIGNTQVDLTPLEYRILKMLIANKDKVVTRNELTKEVWGNTTVSKHTLDTHMTRLKKKIPQLNMQLKSIYGAGFVFEGKR